MLRVVEKPSKENEELRTTLDELLQRGALKMLHEALEAEVDEYVRRHRDARDDRGRAQVVRNGKAPARQLVTGAARWRCARLASTIAARMPTASGTGSPARFFPATCARRRK
jgi:ribosomal protein L4